jgi:hypothetical protein
LPQQSLSFSVCVLPLYIVTAIIGVGGIISGWFLRRFKHKQESRIEKQNYKKYQQEDW